MILSKDFYDLLKSYHIDFYTGVPDSLLKDICAYITEHTSLENHIISPNEGNSVALAAGYHLATGRIPLVYMQNSGLGNAINPITSLADKEVYSIPMLLMIGWRGQPGVKDEPQHVKKGKITEKLLEILEIPYCVLPSNWQEAKEAIEGIIHKLQKTSSPCALLIKNNTFLPYKTESKKQKDLSSLGREEAIKILLQNLPLESKIVATTGKTSRELYEVRELRNDPHFHDFLTVGSMGHASQICFGIALKSELKSIYCFDGDGSTLMHMGSLTQIGTSNLKNFKHIIFNNAAHESVGGQPTVADKINLKDIALSSGYKGAHTVRSEKELLEFLPSFINSIGPSLLEIQIKIGSRADLGRPKESPLNGKIMFMDHLYKNDINTFKIAK